MWWCGYCCQLLSGGQWKGGQRAEQKGIHDTEAISQERVVFALQNW